MRPSTTATNRWGWRMAAASWNWAIHPYWLTRLFQDIGNYGLRGTVREKGRGLILAVRNLLVFRLGGGAVYTLYVMALNRLDALKWRPSQLLYATGARCEVCKCGLAYPKRAHWLSRAFNLPDGLRSEYNSWTCSAVLTYDTAAIADKKGHTQLPFSMFEVRSDSQPARSGGNFTRPVLWGLLGYRHITEREVGNTTRPGYSKTARPPLSIVRASTVLTLLAVLVTPMPGQYTYDGKVYETAEACVIAASEGLGAEARECVQVNKVQVAGDCSDVPAPDFEATQSYAYCPGEKWARIGTSNQERSAYPTCWKVVITPDVSCDYKPESEDPSIFWTPKVVADDKYEETPYAAPLANPQTPPADDPTGTSNTDPPVKGKWMPAQAAP
jgi:hypothetical protein